MGTRRNLLLVSMAFAGAMTGAVGMHLFLLGSRPADSETAQQSPESLSPESKSQVPKPTTIADSTTEANREQSIVQSPNADSVAANDSKPGLPPPPDTPVFTAEASPRPPETAFPETQWKAEDAQQALRHLPGAMGSQGEAFEFSAPIERSAWDPGHGRLAVVQDSGIVLYDVRKLTSGTLAPVGVYPIQDVVGLVCCQHENQTFFLTAKRSVPEIIVLDAESIQPVKTIDLSEVSEGILHLHCSKNPQDSFVYFLNQRMKDFRGPFSEAIGRISVETSAFDSAIPTTVVAGQTFQVSPDGRFIYFNTSSQKLATLSWGDEIKDRFATSTEVVYVGRGREAAPDGISFPAELPNGLLLNYEGWAVTPAYQFPIKKQSLEFSVWAASNDGRVVAGVNDQMEICLASFETGKKYAAVPLPLDFRRQPIRPRARNRPSVLQRSQWFRMETDPDQELIVAATSSHLMIVPMAHEDAPSRSPLMVKVASPLKVVAGQKLEIPVQAVSGDQKQDLQLSLTSTTESETPAAAQPEQKSQSPLEPTAEDIIANVSDDSGKPVFQNGKLVWTPARDGLGARLLRGTVKSEDGNTADLAVEFFVHALPDVRLPFYPRHVSLNHDGSLAFLWGTNEQFPGTRSRPQEPLTDVRLAMVDTSSKTILAERSWPRGIAASCVGGDAVFICDDLKPKSSSPRPPAVLTARIIKLDAKDLREVAEVPVWPTPNRLTNIDDRTIVDNHGHQFTADGLRRLPQRSMHSGVAGDAYVHHGILWDTEMMEPQLLVTPQAFCGREISGNQATLISEGRYATGDGRNPTQIYSFRQNHGVSLAREYPGEFRLQTGSTVVIEFTSAKTEFATSLVRERNSGQQKIFKSSGLLNVSPLHHVPGSRSRSPVQQSSGLVANAPKQVAAVAGKDLYLFYSEKLFPNAEPFHFTERQSTFVLDLDRPSTLTYECPGATLYSLELSLSDFGRRTRLVKLDSKTGSFKVELPSKSDLVSAAGQLVEQFGTRDRIVAIPATLQKSWQHFHQLTGRGAKGVPLPLHVSVKATGDQNRTTTLTHWLLVEVPIEDVQELLGDF